LPETPRFRISAKRFFLTYPQVGDVTLDAIYAALMAFLPSVMVVSAEKHKDLGNHFHVYFEFSKTKNLKNPRYFDVLGLHPNIQSCKSKKNTLIYIIKDGIYKCFGISELELKSLKGGLNEFLAYLSTLPSKADIISKYPAYFFRYPNKVSNFMESARVKRDRDNCGPFPWPDSETLDPTFKIIFRLIHAAVHDKRPLRAKNLYIYGPPATGKSTFFTYLSKYFSTYFGPLDEQFFDLFDHDYKIVVFDEYCSTFPITWINAFCTGHPLSIRKKGSQLLKRTNPLTVILSNLPIRSQYHRVSIDKPAVFEAFVSRFHCIELTNDVNLIPLCAQICPPEISDPEYKNPYD